MVKILDVFLHLLFIAVIVITTIAYVLEPNLPVPEYCQPPSVKVVLSGLIVFIMCCLLIKLLNYLDKK